MNETEIFQNNVCYSTILANEAERTKSRVDKLKGNILNGVSVSADDLQFALDAARRAEQRSREFDRRYLPFLVEANPPPLIPPREATGIASTKRMSPTVQTVSERARNAAASQQSRPPLPGSLQVRPSLSPGQDIHPPEYYRGGGGNYPSLPQGLQTNPGGLSDIHPRGYHIGGGPYLPPGLRTGGGK